MISSFFSWLKHSVVKEILGHPRKDIFVPGILQNKLFYSGF